MKVNTRDKIILKAVESFNEHGYGTVTLQDLAQQLGMSRGNLAYHFKTKEEILNAIAMEMWHQMKEKRKERNNFPSFQNLHDEVQLSYQFSKRFPFLFCDLNVMRHPKIKQKLGKYSTSTIEDNKAAIAFAIQMGNMNPEPVSGIYHNLAVIAMMIPFYWFPQQILQGNTTDEDAGKLVWSNFIPHFTDKGIAAFKKAFGETYYNNLGNPFNLSVDDLGIF